MRHFDHAAAPPAPTAPAVSTAIAVVAPPPWPKSGPRCVVCPSPHREAIEEALLAGTSPSTLETVYGVSREAIDRHTTDCIPVVLERAGVRITAGSVLERLDRLMTETEEFLTAAKSEKDMRAWAAGLQRVERSLALLGRLTGEMRGSDEDALVRSPAWKRFKEAVERALLPYPEAAASLKAELMAVSRSGR